MARRLGSRVACLDAGPFQWLPAAPPRLLAVRRQIRGDPYDDAAAAPCACARVKRASKEYAYVVSEPWKWHWRKIELLGSSALPPCQARTAAHTGARRQNKAADWDQQVRLKPQGSLLVRAGPSCAGPPLMEAMEETCGHIARVTTGQALVLLVALRFLPHPSCAYPHLMDAMVEPSSPSWEWPPGKVAASASSSRPSWGPCWEPEHEAGPGTNWGRRYASILPSVLLLVRTIRFSALCSFPGAFRGTAEISKENKTAAYACLRQ